MLPPRTKAMRITDTISIDESELSESFVRSSGPGGQNVNKVSSAVQLRFDVRHSPSLPNEVAVRRFVDGQIGFPQIFETVEMVMRTHHTGGRSGTSWVASPTLDVILKADLWARKEAERAV